MLTNASPAHVNINYLRYYSSVATTLNLYVNGILVWTGGANGGYTGGPVNFDVPAGVQVYFTSSGPAADFLFELTTVRY